MLPKELILKYLDGTATKEEEAVVKHWYINHRLKTFKPLSEEEQTEDINSIIRYLDAQQLTPKKNLFWPRFVAAASLLFIVGMASYFLLFRQQQAATPPYANKNDIAPGEKMAILTLGNGKKIALNDSANGTITNQGYSIINVHNGQLVYQKSPDVSGNRPLTYDTLTVPKGGIYNITLPDGSKVWSNSYTAIRYPSAFTGKYREVELLYGEAYFEVVHNDKMPFRVLANDQVIEDVGTHFNIDVYPDEPGTTTTLIEGRIKYSFNHQSSLLDPGEQVQVDNQSKKLTVIPHADIHAAMAWKNGQFVFTGQSIQSIMRDISRWYNVDIIYQDVPANNDYIGEFSRYKNVSEVLKVLELTKTVHFKLEGRTITVMPAR
jgi:ferric-dicitrate binding protein FerR (iron transport regulator)